jgi:uncharacterized protein (DUF1810 family)
MSEPYNLQRFLDAQDGTFEDARAELIRGRKTGHWMWFIFPQIAGLGHSETAQKFAISSLDEARAYLAHPILGPRLRKCTETVTRIENRTAEEIFGYPDWLKFRSSMTLFSRAAPDSKIFADALRKYFGGEPDSLTLEKI